MNELREDEKQFILNMTKEQKLNFMSSLLKDEHVGAFMHFSKVLLDAPIMEGGISSYEIDKIFQAYINRNSEKTMKKHGE